MELSRWIIGPIISVIILGIPVRLLYDFWLKEKYAAWLARTTERRRAERIKHLLEIRPTWVKQWKPIARQEAFSQGMQHLARGLISVVILILMVALEVIFDRRGPDGGVLFKSRFDGFWWQIASMLFGVIMASASYIAAVRTFGKAYWSFCYSSRSWVKAHIKNIDDELIQLYALAKKGAAPRVDEKPVDKSADNSTQTKLAPSQE
jgi:hypothetical protein